MKHPFFKLFFAISAFAAMSYFPSCKSKTAGNNADSAATRLPDTTVMTEPNVTAPVTVSPDDSLTTGLKDATKDFPGVTATVSNGEVTLAGNITRDKLPTLMQSVNSLHPKKINNNLTIK